MTNPQAAQALEPCPFCGHTHARRLVSSYEMQDEDDDDYRSHTETFAIICNAERPDGPGGCGASGGFFELKVQAVAAWNRRAATQPAPQPPKADGERHEKTSIRQENTTMGEVVGSCARDDRQKPDEGLGRVSGACPLGEEGITNRGLRQDAEKEPAQPIAPQPEAQALPTRQVQCFGCEGRPAAGNDPCDVCGRSSASVAAVASPAPAPLSAKLIDDAAEEWFAHGDCPGREASRKKAAKLSFKAGVKFAEEIRFIGLDGGM